MTADRLTDRVLDMVDDALVRGLAFGEIVDCVDFTLGLAPIMTPQGPQMQMVGILYVSVKGITIGSTISNTDTFGDPGGVAASQKLVDERVQVCLESIRTTRVRLLAETNGHGTSMLV